MAVGGFHGVPVCPVALSHVRKSAKLFEMAADIALIRAAFQQAAGDRRHLGAGDILLRIHHAVRITHHISVVVLPVQTGRHIVRNGDGGLVAAAATGYHDGKEKREDDTYKRWNGDGVDTEYYADEYEVKAEAVSDALALKAAHGQLCSVTYEVTGDIPSDAGAVPAAAKVKKGGSYTVAPVQTTSQSRYTFSGWRINGVGDVVTEIKDIQQDVKLIGVWTRRSSGGGGGSHKPTVTIPDDVPTGLNGDDHFAYIVGYPNGNVEPNGNITRAEVATIFFRLLTEEVRTANSTQSNSLSDVTRGQWFNHAVSTLSSMGIVKGHNDGTFAPNAPITRAEFAAIAARFDDKNTNTSSKFTDIASHWAKNEIGIAANKGWINGYPDGTFRPNQYITRAEAMTLVNRVLNRLPENSSDLLDSMIKWPDNSDASAWYYLAVQEATNSHAYSDKSKDDKYEKWTTIRDARDWTELEK